MEIYQRVEQRQRIFDDWKVAVGQVFQQATHDALTGLPNRSLLHDRLMMALSESKRRQEMLGILFIDLDHFKKVNDLLGHDVGDRVLTSVAARLLQVIRHEEIIARVGGDEFIAIIRRIQTPQEAGIVGNRLLQSLSQPVLVNDQSLMVTASIGISLYPFDGKEEEILLKNADTAMYRVKKRGGHGMEFFKSPAEQPKDLTLGKEIKKDVVKPHVLIVDDDSDFRSVMQKSLTKEGYVCKGVVSVKEALDCVRLNPPDLVILDLGLRHASGLAFLQNFTKLIKGGEKIPPVVVVSGYNDPEIIEFAKMLGASHFISKPINSKQIVSAVHAVLH